MSDEQERFLKESIMATMKKGILTAVPSIVAYWKHLRKYGKRVFWKAERKAAKRIDMHKMIFAIAVLLVLPSAASAQGCRELRDACMHKEELGEVGQGNCQRYREQCQGRQRGYRHERHDEGGFGAGAGGVECGAMQAQCSLTGQGCRRFYALCNGTYGRGY